MRRLDFTESPARGSLGCFVHGRATARVPLLGSPLGTSVRSGWQKHERKHPPVEGPASGEYLQRGGLAAWYQVPSEMRYKGKKVTS